MRNNNLKLNQKRRTNILALQSQEGQRPKRKFHPVRTVFRLFLILIMILIISGCVTASIMTVYIINTLDYVRECHLKSKNINLRIWRQLHSSIKIFSTRKLTDRKEEPEGKAENNIPGYLNPYSLLLTYSHLKGPRVHRRCIPAGQLPPRGRPVIV